MLVYNVGFVNEEGKNDETQIDVEEHSDMTQNMIEIINLILSLQREMKIKQVTYVEFDKEYHENEETE